MFSLNYLIRIWDKWWYLQSTSVNPKKQKMWKSLEAVMLSSPFARICIYLLNWRDADSDPQFLMEGSQTVDGSLFTKVKTIRIQIILKVLMDVDEWKQFQDTMVVGRVGKVLRLVRVMRILRVFKVQIYIQIGINWCLFSLYNLHFLYHFMLLSLSIFLTLSLFVPFKVFIQDHL